MTEYLLMKRGLYYRPNDCGYTGIRDHAERYSEAEAWARVRPDSGVATIEVGKAPEFTDACFDDLARNHLVKQRDEARAEIEQLRADLAHYADQYCEGWCKESGGYFDDCGGCRARKAIRTHEQGA